MMEVQRPLPSSQFLELKGPHKNSLTKSEMIAGFLQNLALPSVFHRELTPADFELWDRVLSPYSVPAIEYAFDTWGRNGKRFPLPADILEHIDAFCTITSFDKNLPVGRAPLANYWPVWFYVFGRVANRKTAGKVTDEQFAAYRRDGEMCFDVATDPDERKRLYDLAVPNAEQQQKKRFYTQDELDGFKRDRAALLRRAVWRRCDTPNR